MAKPKKQSKMRAFIESLYVDNVQSETRQMDWSEERGEDLEGFRALEAQKCEECGKVVLIDNQYGENRHCDLDSDSVCRGYLYFDGPVMNYFYPCKFRTGVEAAAHAVRDFAVCVVELRDGETGFALTGGGMDLTWDIAGAYVACGQLPPVDKTRLPRFAGKRLTARARRIIAACIESHEVSANWARNGIDDLKRVRKYLAENTAAARKAKREAQQQPNV